MCCRHHWVLGVPVNQSLGPALEEGSIVWGRTLEPGSKSWIFHFLAMCQWAGYRVVLCLSFPK